MKRVTHEGREPDIRNAGYDPTGWTIELTPITDGGMSGYVDGHPIRKPWQADPQPARQPLQAPYQ